MVLGVVLVCSGGARGQTGAGSVGLHNAIVRDRLAQAELQRQLRDRRTVLMHRGVIPRPEGFTTEDLTAKYSALREEFEAEARGRAWRRTHRAAAAARNHPMPVAKPGQGVKQHGQ
jgi:hypothetical protein